MLQNIVVCVSVYVNTKFMVSLYIKKCTCDKERVSVYDIRGVSVLPGSVLTVLCVLWEALCLIISSIS